MELPKNQVVEVAGKPHRDGDSPVDETWFSPFRILSTAGHVKPVGIREDHLARLNTPLVTDSEPVP